tara:strand:+ start:137 stop:349 length:213 start_codon:yes stop_codon:yes gene_type:complete
MTDDHDDEGQFDDWDLGELPEGFGDARRTLSEEVLREGGLLQPPLVPEGWSVQDVVEQILYTGPNTSIQL